MKTAVMFSSKVQEYGSELAVQTVRQRVSQ
jgi:hypothetical protein